MYMTISHIVCTISMWPLSLGTEIAAGHRRRPSGETDRGRSALGGGPAGAAAVEAAVTERDAAGVAPRGQPGGRTARGEEPGDRLAADVQHLGVQSGREPAQGEAAGALPQIDRADRRADRLEPFAASCAAAGPRRVPRPRCRRRRSPAASPAADRSRASRSATVSATQVAGRSMNLGDHEAIASSCASPSMIR